MKIFCQLTLKIGNSMLPEICRNPGKDTEHTVLIDTGITVESVDDFKAYVTKNGAMFRDFTLVPVSEKIKPVKVVLDPQYKLVLPEGEADEISEASQQ